MKKLLASLVFLLAAMSANATTMSIVGLDTVTLDSTNQSITFNTNPSSYYTIYAEGVFAPLDGTTGTTHNVAGPADYANFFAGNGGFHFDIASMGVTADDMDVYGTGYASYSGTSVFTNWHLSSQGGQTSWSATIPNPATLALMGIGLLGLGFAKRKKA